jgi:hypothetical protein
MSWDDPTKMPLYHVQLETRHRIISYEIATQNFNHVEIATMHLCQRLIKGEDYVHVGGCSRIGYADKNDFAQILEAKVTTGQPFEENEE